MKPGSFPSILKEAKLLRSADPRTQNPFDWSLGEGTDLLNKLYNNIKERRPDS